MTQHMMLPLVRALYWRSPDDEPDGVVISALEEVGCQVSVVKTIGDVVGALLAANNIQSEWADEAKTGARHEAWDKKPAGIVLVAEVQAGGLALLDLLRGSQLLKPVDITLIPIFLDRRGDNIQAPIRALSQGAALYLLMAMPDQERRMEISLAVERARLRIACAPPNSEAGALSYTALLGADHADRSLHLARAPASAGGRNMRTPYDGSLRPNRAAEHGLTWDEDRRILHADGAVIMLSAMESRLFGALHRNCGNVVPVSVLAQFMGPFKRDSPLTDEGRVRPHIMRLRRKLAVCPWLAQAIVSVRGVGYMLAAQTHEE